jgi:AraC family transcriptional regulator
VTRAFAPQSGIPTYDAIRLSAPPPDIHEVCRLPDGLSLLVQPRMPDVGRIVVPGVAVDVAVWLVDRVNLDRAPAPDLGVRALRPASLLLLPAGIDTLWEAPHGMPETIHLHIAPDFRERWCEEEGRRRRALVPQANARPGDLGNHLARVRRALASDGAFRRLQAQAAALEAAHLCLVAGLDGAIRGPSHAMTAARLRRVRAYVEENLAGEVCLQDMAACIGLSPSHFSRAFKAELGLSPYAFVVQARVERVKDQLLRGRRSLAEIAIDCGFATQSHMTETFRRATGLPPARWLREHESTDAR